MSRFFDEAEIRRQSSRLMRELQAQPDSHLIKHFLSQIAIEQSQEKTMYDNKQAQAAAQAASSLRAPEQAATPVSALDMAIENVAQASREVMGAIHQLRQRLTPVARPEQSVVGVAIAGGNQVSQEPPESPLVHELKERTRYLLAARDELYALNDRLEV